MTDHDSFLEEIFKHPDDDAPRLVYADWLVEQGDPRGEFIHLQIQRESLEKGSRDIQKLRKRELAILREYETEWAGTVPSLVSRYSFLGGFVSYIRTTAPNFLKHRRAILSQAPVHFVEFIRGPRHLRAVSKCQDVSRLRSLKFPTCDFSEQMDFFDSPHLMNINTLSFHRCTFHGLDLLLESDSLPGLRQLIFDRQYDLTSHDFSLLARSPLLRQLDRLQIWVDYISRQSALQIAQAPSLKGRNVLLLKSPSLTVNDELEVQKLLADDPSSVSFETHLKRP